MKIIKLDATASTNSYMRTLTKEVTIEDFTVVVTENQTNGRGQVHTKWVSEPGKNLTFSVFCLFDGLVIEKQKYLNFAVSLAILNTLKEIGLPNVSIKWPNDILSEKYKICGVLIENTLQSNTIISSIIGVGLNVNQLDFLDLHNKATSIKQQTGRHTDLDELLMVLLEKLKNSIILLKNFKYETLEQQYMSNLFKLGVPSMFKTDKNELFMGKITGVSILGKLQIELDDETQVEFGVKEVSFV